MSNLYNQIVSQRGSLERLFARIPGFRGYQDKQARRTADRMLRDHLAELISQRLARFTRIEKMVLDSDGMALMPRTRDLKSKLQRYHDKVATAAPGYSGMWAQMKIGADELERIYSFDEAQFRYVEKLDPALDAVEKAVSGKDGLDVALSDLEKMIVEAIDAFDLRDDVLTELSRDLTGSKD